MRLFIIFKGAEPQYYTDDLGHAGDMVSDMRREAPAKTFTVKVLEVDLTQAHEI